MRATILNTYHSLARRRRRRRFLLCAAFVLLTPFLALAAFIASRDAWHLLDPQKFTAIAQTLLVYDGDGEVVSRLYDSENRVTIDVAALPDHVKNAFIAAEDARFYAHNGVDPIRIVGAALEDLKAGSFVQGASTITQQLIKLTHLSSEKTLDRKVDEAILAYQLERRYNKEEILNFYLNLVYFGGGYYGVEAAAQGYFGVSAKDLSLAQSALLAGVLKSPSRFAPHLRPEASVGRRGVILDLMQEYGMISEQACKTAKAEPLVLSEHLTQGKRGYYVDLALTESCALLNVEMSTLLSGGYRIETELKPSLQSLCEAAFLNDANFPSVNGEFSEGAVVFVDTATGGIAAIVGGRDNTTALSFNRATRIRRQPGSAIKPILVYAPALEAGYTAASMLLDDATAFQEYMPHNANDSYAGWVTMREAVTRSLNVPAVALFDALGVSRCKAFAERLGIPFSARDNALALALGGFTYGVSPTELAGAYAAIASGGVYRTPHTVTRITDSHGNVLYEAQDDAVRVMQKGNAFVLLSMLQDVAEYGTAKTLGALHLGLAAKTGTVGDDTGNRDIWLAACNPAYAAVVWLGFDDAKNGRILPVGTGGGGYPAMLLAGIFSALYPNGDAPRFVQPDDVVAVQLDSCTLSFIPAADTSARR